jgi:glutamate--cysteine ligase
VGAVCFKTGPPGAVGAELEWLVADPADPTAHVSLSRPVTAVHRAGPLPGGSTLTSEPGGQVELSSLVAPGTPHAPGLAGCLSVLEADVAHLQSALAADGLTLLDTACDPVRAARRQLHAPRYDAMALYFARRTVRGASMMCSTAATQVCVDAGADADDVRRRWRLVHAVGPALVAAFANSPVLHGFRTGWKSSRQLVWSALDRGRVCPQTSEPATGWAEHALAAPVMVRRTPSGPWHADPGFTFAEWVHRGAAGDVPAPTLDDLDYHLGTLFPPVRPRGYLEVRYLDAQPGRWWPVPVAVLVALVEDLEAGRRALDAVRPLHLHRADPWTSAAREATADPLVATAARACLRAALDALPRLGADPRTTDLVAEFADRFTDRGRCPADDHPVDAARVATQEQIA